MPHLHADTHVWETQAGGEEEILWRCRKEKVDALAVLSGGGQCEGGLVERGVLGAPSLLHWPFASVDAGGEADELLSIGIML